MERRWAKVGPHKTPLCHRPTQRQTTAPNAQFNVASSPSGRVTWRKATLTQGGSAQELNLQPTFCGWWSANNCTPAIFFKGRWKVNPSQTGWHSPLQEHVKVRRGSNEATRLSSYTSSCLWRLWTDFFAKKQSHFFFLVLLHNKLSHLRMPAEQKSREGPPSPVTGNVQRVSEKLARASLVSAFNVWRDGSVGLCGTPRLYMCAGKASRYKLFSCMRTRPHRGWALTDPASFHLKQMCLCLLPSL